VRFPFVKGRARPPEPASNPEEMLLRARALFRTEESQDLRGVIAEKIEDLGHYDVLAMDRVAAILMWGRSGSLLLSSYLDGHADVMLLPQSCGQRLYEFFERYQSLPLRDKLIGYAAFEPDYPGFFDGDFAISPDQYYAAVQAILEFSAKWPAEFLESRRAFFLFVHIAYNLALGRRPPSSPPLIVYCQHVWDNAAARKLVEDFPQAKFVHTIRDPISSCDGIFRHHFKWVQTHIMLPYSTLFLLINKDRPQFGMESRTRTIRFEDLHSDTAETMRDISDWLGLPYQATLLDSTFNGVPMLYENFVEWNYPCPKIFGNPMVRWVVFLSLFLVPMKMEIVAARAVFKERTLPSLRKGNIWAMIKFLSRIALCRVVIIGLLAPAFFRRCAFGTTLLRIDHKRRPLERREDGARAARNETELE
jgi:hypothetical protein